MAKRSIVEIVSELALPIVEKNQFELVDVVFVREGAHWFLRIFIDKPSGISIDDCQIVSEALGKVLDEVDPIEQHYYLEVSSPGLDRPLKTPRDFQKYTGQLVEVKLCKPLDGKKIFEGELVGLADAVISIRTDQKTLLAFPEDKVTSVKRVIVF